MPRQSTLSRWAATATIPATEWAWVIGITAASVLLTIVMGGLLPRRGWQWKLARFVAGLGIVLAAICLLCLTAPEFAKLAAQSGGAW